jgi:katanin p60 ATPase-containing subunit A1
MSAFGLNRSYSTHHSSSNSASVASQNVGGGSRGGTLISNESAMLREVVMSSIISNNNANNNDDDDDNPNNNNSSSTSISFDDIVGLENAKELLNESIILPLLIPEFFTNFQEPWKGVLLFGPPGTGKTMLAKAVAQLHGITFFNATSSLLINKYRGESEKMLKCLFDVARERSPSIIFVDEVDALMAGGESDESSRRLATELLKQIDGVESCSASLTSINNNSDNDDDGSNVVGAGQVLFCAATNLPWELDEALRRRLEKRVYVGLPNESDRAELISKLMTPLPSSSSSDAIISAAEYQEIARLSDGYSGADLKLVCREAAMMPVRRLLDGVSIDEIVLLKEAGRLGIEAMDRVSMDDLTAALKQTKKTVSDEQIAKITKWGVEFGSI